MQKNLKNTFQRKSTGQSVINIFFYQSLIAVSLVVIILGYFWIYREYQDFNQQIDQIRLDYLNQQKSLIKKETEAAVDYIEYSIDQSREQLREILKSRVYDAHHIAENIYSKYKGEKSRQEISNLIKEALRPVRFNNGRGYYFIGTLDGYDVLYPVAPQFEGKYLYNLQDDMGNYVMQDELNVVNTSGEGFVTDYWRKPGEKGSMIYPKLSFVKLFEPLNWYIGAGDYLDEFNKDLQQEMLERMSDRRFGEEGYIFINTYDGVAKITDGKIVEDSVNIWNLEDPKGIKVIQEERRAVKNPEGDFIYYHWRKLHNDSIAPKMSFVKGIPEWEWMIGAGVYIDDIENVIAVKKTSLKKKIQSQLITIVILLAFTLLVLYFYTFYLSKKAKKALTTFQEFFRRASDKNVRINPADVPFKEFQEMALLINRLLDNLKQSKTKQQESTIFFKHLFESSPEAIALLDSKYHILQVNNMFTRLFGYEKKDCTDKDLDQLIVPHDHIEQASVKNKLLDDGKDVSFETRRKTKSGIIIPVSVLATPIHIRSDKVGFYVIYRDITGQKQHERELDEARQKAEESDRLKTSFLANMSHEIRTPMNAIIGFSSLLEEPDLTERNTKEYVRIIKTASKNLLTLIDDIIAVSKIEANQIYPEKDYFNLKDLLEKLHNSFMAIKNQQGKKNLKLSISIPNDDLNIYNDEKRIEQIFSYLLDNAIKFTEEGEVKYGYKLNPNEISFFVEDTGIGIEEEMQKTIFERFRQVDESPTRRYSGTGLGLTIAKSMVELLGGRITLESKKNNGSKFVFSLPLLKEKTSLEKTDRTVKDLSGKIILIAEDVVTNYLYLESAIKPFNVTIIWAKNGKEAIDLTEKEKPDLVLMDIQMPVMDGNEAMHGIKKINKKIPVIAQTAYAMEGDLRKIKEEGYDDFIIKPINLDKLYGIINRFIS